MIYYNLLLWLLLPYIFFHLMWRSRKQSEYRQRITERFAAYVAAAPTKPVLWLHTVSVGETRAVVSLVDALQHRYPDFQLLLTHTTPTGMATCEQLFGDRVLRVYLPYDFQFAVRGFLRHFQPRLGVLLETEIWPNLIHQCRVEHLPLLLLNARLSERSARRYARFPGLSRMALGNLAGIAAQTQEDAARLARLGADNITVMGNLKFDIEPPLPQLELGMKLRCMFGEQRPIFLAASTREGEESLLLAELETLARAQSALLVVIVPRHPQRFDEVAALMNRLGVRYQRRSANQPIAAETQVVLGDSMGEMFAYFAACDLAFIGGSLLKFGGQNLLEACAVGKPVLLGPHTYNFAQASELAIQAGAARRVPDASALAHAAAELLGNPKVRAEMSRQATRFVVAHQGATTKALAIIGHHLDTALVRS